MREILLMSLPIALCRKTAVMALVFLAANASAQNWTTDSTFILALEGTTGVNGVVYPVAYPGGKLLVNTSYTYVNGVNAFGYVIRLNADGTTDLAFHTPAPDPNVHSSLATSALFVYPDGRVLLAVGYDSNTGRILVRRLATDGSIDTSFTPTLLDSNNVTMRLLSDGRIVTYGPQFGNIDGTSCAGIAIIKANGGADTGFHSPFPTGTYPSLAYATPSIDGQRIIICGQFSLEGTTQYVARLNLDGTIDSTFAPTTAGFSVSAARVYPIAGGGMLVGSQGGDLVRLAPSGTKDSTFTSPTADSRRVFGPQQSDGKIYYTTLIFGSPSTRELRRMNSDGTPDASFASLSTPYSSSYEVGLPVLSDDGTLFEGALTSARHDARLEVTHVLANGSIDSTYNPRFSRPAAASAYARTADGKHLVAGSFDDVSGAATPATYDLVRLNENGTLDSSFAATLAGSVNGVVAIPNGKILLNGNFSGGSLVRLNSDGTKDTSFQGANLGNAFSFGTTFAVDSAGSIYGPATGGTSQLVRFTADGQPDGSFQTSSAMGVPTFFAPLLDGSVLVGRTGTISTVIRILHNGTIDPNFSAIGISDLLVGLTALPDGTGLACGRARDGSGNYFYTLTRIRPDGTTNYTYSSASGSGAGIADAVKLGIAGELISLLRQASPGAVASLQFDLQASNLTDRFNCRTDGQVMIVEDIAGFGSYFSKYQQSGFVGGTAPFVIQYQPSASPYHVPLYGRFFSPSVLVGGTSPAYQWLKDGIPVSGQTDLFLHYSSTKVTDAGTYTFKANNDFGSITTGPFTLIVDTANPAVTVTSQPTGQTVTVGGSAAFSVAAVGTAPLSYQWRRNGVPIEGATGSTLTLPGVTLADSGAAFDVVVSTNVGSLASSAAILTLAGSTTVGGDVYFGTISGAGQFSAFVRPDGDATLEGFLPGGRGSFVVKFTVSADGGFNVSLAVAASSPIMGQSVSDSGSKSKVAIMSLSGHVGGGSFTGSISASGDTFTGTAQIGTGSTAAMAGYYEAPVLNASTGTMYFIVGPSGSLFGGEVTAAGTSVASGTVSSDGQFIVSLGASVALQGSIGATTGKVNGQVTTNGSAGIRFGGVSASTIHTDRLVNISTRGLVGDGEKVMIAGFVVSGNQPKTVMVRASGPALTGYGVGGAMDNPVLKIFHGTDEILSNDDWSSSTDASLLVSAATRVGAFSLTGGSKDAALIATLAPGIYSAQVTRAANSSTGVALVEVYDASLDPGNESQKMVNISTRGEVRGGESIMIAGFVITGNAPKKVLIRGVGPTLGSYGVGGTLENPFLKLYDGEALIGTNDDWGADGGEASLATAAAQVGGFPLNAGSKDAALLLTLAPGIYSAQVSGVNGGTGIALLEVYEVP